MSRTLEQLFSTIHDRYSMAKYHDVGTSVETTIHFVNDFSHHFIFVFDCTEDLDTHWKQAHEQLIEGYQNFDGSPDMEWNFYGIFVVIDPSDKPDAFVTLRNEIESDATFSRKFLITAEDAPSLPPSMITQEDLGRGKQIQTDLIHKWKQALGGELFRQISECPKSAISDRVTAYVGTKKHA